MKTSNCLSCKSIQEDAYRCIFYTKHCKVVMRTDDPGAWLGRCIIVPHQHFFSPSDLLAKNPEILLDIYKTRKLLVDVYEEMFGMTLVNWAQLGNLTRDNNGNSTTEHKYYHFHYHFIPRYEKAPIWDKREWKDEQWGKALNIDPKKGHTKRKLGNQGENNDDEKLLLFVKNVQSAMLKRKLINENQIA